LKNAWNWFKNFLIRIIKAFIVVIILMMVIAVFISSYPYDIVAQVCAEQYSQVLGMGPLGVYDVDGAVMDFVEAHIHPGMSRMEVMSALPEIRHWDYFPPYWDEGEIDIFECPIYNFAYEVEFNGDELISIARLFRLVDYVPFWYLR
jgi:hypothetical protein